VLAREVDDVRAAIGESTAMIYTTSLGGTLEKLIAIAKQAKTPLLLDDAAGIPPLDNLKLYAKMGVDLYCFSGGKGLCAPQCAQPPVERARRAHPEACRYGSRRQNRNPDSRRRKPLSDPGGELG